MNCLNINNGLKVGIITVAHLREPSEAARKIIEDCNKAVKDYGCDVIYNNKILTSNTEVRESLIELKVSNVDAIIAIVTNWVEPPTLVQPLSEIGNIPLILWGFPETDYYLDQGIFFGSSSAAAVIKSAFEQMNYKFQYIMGMPEEPASRKRLETALDNIRVTSRLKRSKIGLIGYNSMGIYTATFDQLGLKKHFGIEIDNRADSYIVVKMMEEIKEDEIEEVRKRFDKGYVFAEDTKQSLELSLKMYLALKKLVKEGEWDALSVKCQHEFTSYLRCAACLPLSMLTDEGVMCSDEGDIHAAVTMLIMRNISDAVLFFGDIYPYNHRSLLMSHCGLVPHSCHDNSCDIVLNPMSPRISKDGINTGGIVSTLRYKSGKVTLARLEGRGAGSYAMHILEGTAYPVKSIGSNYSTVEIRLDSQMDYDSFVRNQISNHYIMIYDEIEDKLRKYCRYNRIMVL
ncbi:MAG TPA: hypothetical protein GXX20_09295 [Clostridiaceae bacterium]|nr:hypothetical protein [Clostridiaceae bacterium]